MGPNGMNDENIMKSIMKYTPKGRGDLERQKVRRGQGQKKCLACHK
jgi:hypothetical protein